MLISLDGRINALTIKNKTEIFLQAKKEVGLEVKINRSKHTCMTRSETGKKVVTLLYVVNR
jgi:hypothetical protein